MSDSLDDERLSAFVSAIVERKTRPITMNLTGAYSFLKLLVQSGQQSAQEALGYSSLASGHAADASGAATSALTVFNAFTSTYLGVRNGDPSVSSQGNPILSSAFYIRSSDGRLRYNAGLTSGGSIIWQDATVSADLSSISAAGAGVFLGLQVTTAQTVKSQVTFQGTVLGKRVDNWGSLQFVTAQDVTEVRTALQTAITAEETRAKAAENSIGGGRVAKVGDIMTGSLQISGIADVPSLILKNNSTTGRQYRFHSSNDGRLRLVDDTGNTELFSVSSTGAVSVFGDLSTPAAVSGGELRANTSAATDSMVKIQTAGVTRWSIARSPASSRLYIGRYNSTGILQDTPISIAESNGAVTVNQLNVNGNITAKTNISISSAGASVLLNNSSGSFDTNILFMQLGLTRWQMGRSIGNGTFYINRHSDAGAFLDTPFYISEQSGDIYTKTVRATGIITASSEIVAPVLKADASGTGQNVRIGNDAWIGDGNIPNGLSIRGQADFNAGFVNFGNSNLSLGCTPGDNTLKYGGQPVYTAANLTPDTWGYDYGTTGSVDWSKRPAGKGKIHVTMSGYMTFNQQRVGQEVAYPFPLEKIIAYHLCDITPNDSVDRDQLAQFSGVPTLTSVRVTMQETAGQSGYPIGARWTVEGIIAS